MKIREMTIRDWWTLMVSPQGRVNRFDYNIKFLVTVFVFSVIAFVIDYARLGDAVLQPGASIYATWAINIIFLWPTIVVSIKRLHDFNYRGWWLIVMYVLPILVGSFALGYFAVHEQYIVGMLVGLLLLAIFITVLVVLSCARGTRGPNRFGADPNENNLQGVVL